MTALIVLTGPPAAGKNAVGGAIAERCERCALVDVDALRHMVIRPHKAPWEGEEGQSQHELGVRNACLLAARFIAAGFDTVILDVVSDETAQIYREELGQIGVRIVQLMPTFKEIERRNRTRPVLTEEQVRWVYEGQERFASYDEKVDNTSRSPTEVAQKILLT